MNLRTIVRSLLRSCLNSSIIVVSLAIGMACMGLISIFIIRESKADGFHKNKDRIYALQADDPISKGQKMYYIRYGAAEYMKDNFSEVEDYCRIINANPTKVLADNKEFFNDNKTIAASSNFFSFFSYQLLSGSPAHALEAQQDIVISDRLALRYFGASNPIGKRITLTNGDKEVEMFVSGVFKKPEESTQLDFEMVKLIGEDNSRCYLLLSKDANVAQLEEKFAQYKEEIPIVHTGTAGTHYLKDLQSAYFDTARRQTIEKSRDKTDLYIALVIALMILGVALFNYLGLINNHLVEKYKENAIRMINGGSKGNLVARFMGETFILVGIAFLLSLGLINLSASFFNQLTASSITESYIFTPGNFALLLGIPVFILFISCLFTLIKIGKRIQPEALKPGKIYLAGKFNIPIFNVAQLGISIILIVGSIIIIKQINYITNKDIGLNKDVLEVKIPIQYKDISHVFKTELERQPAVEMISLANASPVLEHIMRLLKYDDNGVEKEYTPSVFPGDQNYTKALGIQIVEGEDFSEDAESNKGKCIINQSMASLLSDQDLIGKPVPGNPDNIVIGICKDFHYGSLKRVIAPAYIPYGNEGYYLMLKPASGQNVQAREAVAQTWNRLIKDFPLNVESIGERYEWMHRENENYAKLIATCCLISVFLSMIGLFAVSFHSSRRRIKEIGVRKVNGAKITEILSMLNKDFVKWVVIAFVIATPIAYYVMHNWLDNFAYKTNLSWWIFALAGLLALGIALLTVSWQSWRAATRNPVEALRYE
ncbi:MAG: ABC transporter permease [Prolixibacteraceae bacterium]|nr:ABC transporter permease [Prolixibacteraceae bacterium]